MDDKTFLKWIHNRLITVYGENMHIDHIHRLRAIIRNYPENKTSDIDRTVISSKTYKI